jgi:hypothetical protein
LVVTATAAFYAAAPGSSLAATCTTVQARCAIEAGGKCDPQTGRWCYGINNGENCGGTPSTFQACMARHGMQVYGAQVPKATGPAATLSNPGKCTSVQAQCAIEIGGTCDTKTGRWCYGHTFGRNCGGSDNSGAFDACVSRKLGQNK